MKDILQLAKKVATKVIVEAGTIAKERVDQVAQMEEKDEFGDLVTEVDYLAEAIIS
jgi:myo-inositol-1(or 4)-monophosphatase